MCYFDSFCLNWNVSELSWREKGYWFRIKWLAIWYSRVSHILRHYDVRHKIKDFDLWQWHFLLSSYCLHCAI